jgi:hypothetical protein
MRMLQKCELSQRAAAPTQMFDNNQPTMVRKCQMAMKDQQSSATQSPATDDNAILLTSKRKSRQQPPPASKPTSVRFDTYVDFRITTREARKTPSQKRRDYSIPRRHKHLFPCNNKPHKYRTALMGRSIYVPCANDASNVPRNG